MHGNGVQQVVMRRQETPDFPAHGHTRAPQIHLGRLDVQPPHKYQRTSDTATTGRVNPQYFQVDGFPLAVDTRLNDMGTALGDALDSTLPHRQTGGSVAFSAGVMLDRTHAAFSLQGEPDHESNMNTMMMHTMYPQLSAGANAGDSELIHIPLPAPLSSKSTNTASHPSQRLAPSSTHEGRSSSQPSFNMSLGTLTDAETMQYILSPLAGTSAAGSSNRMSDMLMRVQRIVQRMRRRPPSAGTVKRFPIVAHRYFPIVSAVLASVESLVDPTMCDGMSWGSHGMVFDTLDSTGRGQFNIQDAELLSMMEQGDLLEEGGNLNTSRGKRPVAADTMNTKDYQVSRGKDLLKDLEDLLTQVENHRNMYVKKCEELSHEQRAVFDPEFHSSSNDVLMSLSRTAERYKTLHSNVSHMVVVYKAKMDELESARASSANHVVVDEEKFSPGDGQDDDADEDHQLGKAKAKIHKSTRRNVELVDYKEDDEEHQDDEVMDCDLPGNKRATSILKRWLYDNFLHPYPTSTDKKKLAQASGLSKTQVSNWFINARVRLWRPLIFKICEDSDMKAMENEALGGHNNPGGPSRKIKVRTVPQAVQSSGAGAKSSARSR